MRKAMTIQSDEKVRKTMERFLSYGDISLRKIRTQGFEYLTDPDVRPCSILSTELQRSGFDRVHNLFGPRAIGKTQFCLVTWYNYPHKFMYVPEVMVHRTARNDEIPGIHYIPWSEKQFNDALA